MKTEITTTTTIEFSIPEFLKKLGLVLKKGESLDMIDFYPGNKERNEPASVDIVTCRVDKGA